MTAAEKKTTEYLSIEAIPAETLAQRTSQFANEKDDHFSISSDGHVIWHYHKDNKPPAQHILLAKLTRGETLYTPGLSLVHTASLEEAQIKSVEQRLNNWLENHIRKTLDPILKLQDVGIKGTAKGIAFQLYEEYGILFRPRIQKMISDLQLEDRQALSRLGVRMGAHYVYVKEALKPALVDLTATLWRTFNPKLAEHAVTPPDGNVSMSAPENAPKRFYLAIGYPIFGDLAVRVDMIERLNSTIFEKAVEGEYVFDPALSSTIGASNEQTQKVLDDLGFLSRLEKRPKESPAEENTPNKKTTQDEPALPEAAEPILDESKDKAKETVEKAATSSKETDEDDGMEEVRIYLLKRRKIHTASQKKPSGKRAMNPKNKGKGSKDKKNKSKKIPTNTAPKGHNAFAGLDKLLAGDQKK